MNTVQKYNRIQMKIQPKYTISEATELLGFASRSTINKRTKDGSISYNMDDNGNKIIDAVELERVFKERYSQAISKLSNTANTAYSHSAKIQSNTPKNTANTALLEQQIDVLQEQLSYERTERERERNETRQQIEKYDHREQNLLSQLEKAQETVSQQTRLLEHHQKPTEKPIDEQETILATNGSKNLSMTLYDLLWAFIIGVMCVVLVITTKDTWLPYADMLMK